MFLFAFAVRAGFCFSAFLARPRSCSSPSVPSPSLPVLFDALRDPKALHLTQQLIKDVVTTSVNSQMVSHTLVLNAGLAGSKYCNVSFAFMRTGRRTS